MSSRTVLVVVPTFRRPELLPALIGSIREQADECAPTSRILVIDNDPEASARGTAGLLGVDYVHEERPGIAAVRQRALTSASEADLLIMVDDDNRPSPGWLRHLLDSWHETRAAVVVGHVQYLWPPSAERWMVDGGFMRRIRHPRHRPLSNLATGNVLVDVAQCRRLGVGFDLSLGLLGGEDLMFGKDVRRAGGTIVACPDSIVQSDVPEDRATRDFVRRRAVGHGRTRTRYELRGLGPVRQAVMRPLLLVGGLVRLLAFSALRMSARLRGRSEQHADATRRTWFAMGRIGGVFGLRTREYARKEEPEHGR